MHPVTPCPEDNVLRRFMLGMIAGDDAESLDRHVETCEACGGRVASLPAEDDLVAAMRERSPIASETDCPLVHHLVDQVRGLCPSGLTTPADPYSRTVTETEVYDFFERDGSPDCLGWLGPYRVERTLGRG